MRWAYKGQVVVEKVVGRDQILQLVWGIGIAVG